VRRPGGREQHELDADRPGGDVPVRATTAGGHEQSDRNGGGPGVM
jgi:hypothetical protein